MKKVLLCPPSYYDIEYEINPWMHVENKVDHQKAKEEYTQLKAAFEKLGVETLEIEQPQGLPDMVYAANIGFPIDKKFVKANFKYRERQGESPVAKEYFEKLGFSIKEIPDDISFEGQGDLLSIGGKYFFGFGKRSDHEAKVYLEKFLDAELIDFELIDPYYYHLDMCLAPLTSETVAINPESFTSEGLEKIYDHFENIIAIGKEDNQIMACNMVVVDKTIVIGQGISQRLKDALKEFDFTTIEIPMDEFRKGGGSIKCMTLEFY
jgi:N-dimethylarginine dimethylaminohydrolase